MGWNYGSALQASSYYNTCTVTYMYAVAARQLSPQIKGKNGSLIKQPAAAFQRRSKVSVVASPAMLRPCGAGTGVGGR